MTTEQEGKQHKYRIKQICRFRDESHSPDSVGLRCMVVSHTHPIQVTTKEPNYGIKILGTAYAFGASESELTPEPFAPSVELCCDTCGWIASWVIARPSTNEKIERMKSVLAKEHREKSQSCKANPTAHVID